MAFQWPEHPGYWKCLLIKAGLVSQENGAPHRSALTVLNLTFHVLTIDTGRTKHSRNGGYLAFLYRIAKGQMKCYIEKYL